ncbi:MAG: XRE family transcriptional regulator [Planctomycetota bacterium]|jgi:SOS-response transcriptional repressor LexA
MGTGKAANDLCGVGGRLRSVRAELGLSQTELAEAVGVTQSTIGAYDADSRPPPLPVALALEHVVRINHRWLLEGVGERRTGPRLTRPVIVTSQEELRALRRLEGEDHYYAVPYLRDPAAAGAGLVMEEQVAGYCIIHRRVAPRPETIRCVRISGDSMAPTLTDGSIVAVDITPVPLRNLEGRIVCCRTGEGAVVIKRLRVRNHFALLFSDNEDQRTFPPIVLDLRELEDPVIGQVIWAWVDLR